MFAHQHKSIAILDDIRIRHGIHPLRGAFHELAGSQPDHAARLLNDSRVQFPTVFSLHPEIVKNDLFPRLNERNRFCLGFSNPPPANAEEQLYQPEDSHLPHLKWMLETGQGADGLNATYDEALDRSALLLSKVFGDRGSLKAMENLIFTRYRKGAYIYDLVWAYFECCTPDDLMSMTRRLNSSNPKDAELARQFLNFVPCVANPKRAFDPVRQEQCAWKWLKRNRDSLYYTGETNQQRSNPVRFAVDRGGREGNDD